MSGQPEMDELRKREELGCGMGGADKIKRHRDLGKLTLRERVAGKLDDGSFHDIGAPKRHAKPLAKLRATLEEYA